MKTLVCCLAAFLSLAVSGAVCVHESFDTYAWGHWASEKADAKVGHDPSVGRSKPGSGRIRIGGAPGSRGSACLLKTFEVQPGREYTALVWVKAEGLEPSGKVSLSFQGKDAKLRFLGTPVIYADRRIDFCRDWKRLVLTFTVPSQGRWNDCRNLMVTISVPAGKPGVLWADDFEFFETEEED